MENRSAKMAKQFNQVYYTSIVVFSIECDYLIHRLYFDPEPLDFMFGIFLFSMFFIAGNIGYALSSYLKFKWMDETAEEFKLELENIRKKNEND